MFCEVLFFLNICFSKHLIPLVSTFLREEPQRVVDAVVCIANASAAEQQQAAAAKSSSSVAAGNKSDASPVDRAISHALQLLQHDYSRLFDALLASRDFQFLLRVGRRLQIVFMSHWLFLDLYNVIQYTVHNLF